MGGVTAMKGRAMNWDRIQGNWNRIKGRAMESWGRLTDDVPGVDVGDGDQILGLLQHKYGKTREEARQALDNWMAGR